MSQNLKLGKLPARLDAVKLKLSNYTSITPPAKAGHQNLVKQAWGMLGNDQYGDCVWAGADHETMEWNASANKKVVFSSQNALYDYGKCTGFKPTDPSTDKGTDMQVAASYRKKNGLTDGVSTHKIGAYVALTVGDETQVKQSIYLFGAVGIGLQFPKSAMDQFNAGKNWTVVKGSPIEGGHYICGLGYDSRYIYVVTWGKLIRMSWEFYRTYSDEALAYLSEEALIGGKSLEGFDVQSLQKDLDNL